MAIQNRRGAYTDFDPSRMLPGEYAIVLSGDPSDEDGYAVYMCFASGVVKRLVLSEQMEAAIDAIMDDLQYDSVPTAGSPNLLTSGTIKTALDGKQNTLTFDSTPTANSNNPVTSAGIKTALDNIMSSLQYDAVPTDDSQKLVKSGGIKTALDEKQDTLTFDNIPTASSNNPVKSGGVYSDIEAIMSVIADPLDTISYSKGDYVTYNKKLYRANQDVDCSSYPAPMIIPYYWDVVTVEDALASTKESILYLFGPAYNSNSTYDVGDCVCTNGNGYRCTTAITTPEAWNSAHWTTTNVYNEISALIKNLGTGFVLNKQYAVGDYCLYGFPKQSLYRCVTAYAGYWDASKWERTTITDELKTKQGATVVGTSLIIS